MKVLTDKVDAPEVLEELLAVDGLHLVAEAPRLGAALLAVHVPATNAQSLGFQYQLDRISHIVFLIVSSFSCKTLRNDALIIPFQPSVTGGKMHHYQVDLAYLH